MKKYESCLTVGELKKILQNLDDNMLIGRAGHFGEFLEMKSWNVSTRDVRRIPLDKNGYKPSPACRMMEEKKTHILEITSPDIGPDPD